MHEEVTGKVLCGFRKAQLTLAHVGEMGFIHESVGDRPRMSQVPLLESTVVEIAKSGNICPRSFEFIERLDLPNVIEVIIGSEILAIVDLVIETDGELIFVVSAYRHYDTLAVGM